MKKLNINPMDLAVAMTAEILDVIDKYEDVVHVPTILGLLDIIKHGLINEHYDWASRD